MASRAGIRSTRSSCRPRPPVNGGLFSSGHRRLSRPPTIPPTLAAWRFTGAQAFPPCATAPRGLATSNRPLDRLRQLGGGGGVIWTRATASTGGHGPPASPHQSQARAADDTLPLPPLGPRHATETSWSDPKGGRAWPSKAGSKIFLLDMANPRGICPPEMGVKTPLPSAIRCSIHVCARPIRCSPGH
jgi:hypothetical protein